MFIFHFPSSGLKVFVREKIARVNIHIKKRYGSNRNKWKLMPKIAAASPFSVAVLLVLFRMIILLCTNFILSKFAN